MKDEMQVRPLEHARMSPESTPTNDLLADPRLRRTVEDFVRKRVPASEVDDVVQTVFCDALAAQRRPEDASELTRWLIGIAKHKVADLHRRAKREPMVEAPEMAAGPDSLEARSLARWAEEQVGESREGDKTLHWMAREGEGETLEAIAAEEKMPAARVRQRVSRMRRWMKERWMAELAAAAALAAFALIAWWILRKPPEEAKDNAPKEPSPIPSIAPEIESPLDRARAMRAEALEKCERGEWQLCLDGLDAARALDPVGDQAKEIGAAREKAKRALEAPKPVPSASSLNLSPSAPKPPSTVAPPPVKPTPKSTPFGRKNVKPSPKDFDSGESLEFSSGHGRLPDSSAKKSK